MRALTRRFLVPVALTTFALTASACSAPSHQTGPGAGPTPVAKAAADSSEQLDVAAAPTDAPTPTAVAAAGSRGNGAKKTALTVAAYDKSTGRAVISKPSKRSPDPSPSSPSSPSAPSTEPTDGSSDAPTAGPSDGPESDAPVRSGDIIASAPAPGAPDGLLAEVIEVVNETEQGTEVRTKPTTLNAVLNDDKADGEVPVDPSTMDVEPLVEGVKFSWAKPDGITFGPNGAKLPLGSLRLDVGTSIATAKDAPASAAASVAGFVQLSPQVEFSYDGSGNGKVGKSVPRGAFLGLSGDWDAQWRLKGRASGEVKQRIPFAKLHADPVIQVGPVPVVVNLDLTCYIQVEADGRITLDVEQKVNGDFRVGGSYSRADGWKPVSTSEVKGTPITAKVTAGGQAKAVLGAEASVGLYGLVGVSAEFAPYLRGEAAVTATASSDGKASIVGNWALYGGFDLNGNLQLQLSIFGTPVFSKRVPLGSLHREWTLVSGKGSASTPS
ncbi:hypothetical protein V1460_29160 [Streptomyces sp. SCSIO 30461]|uniref:hypothetical protein n=1 Tax=Streptomyces sp. SCSIO 30461 TaxID=3118085 RepID=UPI0030D510FB